MYLAELEQPEQYQSLKKYNNNTEYTNDYMFTITVVFPFSQQHDDNHDNDIITI